MSPSGAREIRSSPAGSSSRAGASRASPSVEDELEPAAGDVVERVGEQPAFFGSRARSRWNWALGGNSSVSVSPLSSAGCASRSRDAVGIRRAPRRPAGPGAPRPPGAARARGSGAPTGTGTGSGSARPACGSALRALPARGSVPGTATAARDLSLLQPLEPEGDRLAGEVARGPRHLDERELERQARVAALAHVVDRDREQVDEPQHRRLAELVRLRAQPLARLLGHAAAPRAPRRGAARASAGAGARSGRCTSRPRSCPRSDSSSRYVSAPAVSRSITRSQRRKSASSSTVPSSSSTDCTVTLLPVAEASWSSVDSASRYAPRAAARDERERLVGRVDPLGVGDQAQHLDEILQARPLEDERLAARAHGRQHLREIGRAEDEDEVRRRLLDQLQERVPGGVRELVRLVEDVDLVAPLDRLEHDAVADLADVVDAALRRGVHLDHVERRARRRSRGTRGTCRRASSSGPARS